jgi:hypothetical protein
MSFQSNIRPYIFLNKKKGLDGYEQQRWPKREPQSQAQEELEK